MNRRTHRKTVDAATRTGTRDLEWVGIRRICAYQAAWQLSQLDMYCLVSVLRGTTSTFGDVLDNGTVATSGIPASIAVRSKTVRDGADQTPRVIQQVIGASGSTVDIRDTEQLCDDTHVITYAVQAVTHPPSVGLVRTWNCSCCGSPRPGRPADRPQRDSAVAAGRGGQRGHARRV